MYSANNFVPETISSEGFQHPTLNTSTNGERPRRMRSERGGSHISNGHTQKKGGSAVRKVEYHDRKNVAPMFVKKIYAMINTSDPALATWTDDGKMFVIKDQDTFAKEVIPQFFDLKKFTSFTRQLNFYGFRKMQSKALYKNQGSNEANTHVTFINENFQRGKPELLKQISRSTSTKGVQPNNNQEMETLKGRVHQLESKIRVMKNDYEARFSQLEAHIYNLTSYSNGEPPNTSNMPHIMIDPSQHPIYRYDEMYQAYDPPSSGDGTDVAVPIQGTGNECDPLPPVKPERGVSSASILKFNVDDLTDPSFDFLPALEETYFVNIMTEDSNNPHQRPPNQAALTRQISRGINYYPPLGEPM